MNRTRALIASLAVGLAAIAGVFALGHTLALGGQSGAVTDRQVVQRTAQLDRYQASLQKALARKPPALPAVPTSGTAAVGAQAAAPVRVVFHRAPPVVVTQHASGEHEETEFGDEHGGQQGVEWDD